MLCPLNVGLKPNRFVNVTCSFLISEESILKLDILFDTIAFRFFTNQLTGFFVPYIMYAV